MNGSLSHCEQFSVQLWTVRYLIVNNSLSHCEQFSIQLWTILYPTVNSFLYNCKQFSNCEQFSTPLWTVLYPTVNNSLSSHEQTLRRLINPVSTTVWHFTPTSPQCCGPQLKQHTDLLPVAPKARLCPVLQVTLRGKVAWACVHTDLHKERNIGYTEPGWGEGGE